MKRLLSRNSFRVCVLLISMGTLRSPALPAQSMTPQEFEIYSKAKSVVDLSEDELIHAYPELLALEFKQDPAKLDLILKKVGENVESFFNTFLNTASVERVRQERRNLRGILMESHKQDFQYLLLANLKSGRITLEESRTDTKGKPINYKKPREGLFLTSGFASIPVFLHPLYQPACRFRYLGEQITDTAAFVIAFAQDPTSGHVIAGTFDAENVRGYMLFQGFVWIDASSYQIIRMRTDLLAPRFDLGLLCQTTEIWLSEVRLGPLSSPYWLPREVIVTHEWNSKVYRNQHRYSDYKLFSVESYEKRDNPQMHP